MLAGWHYRIGKKPLLRIAFALSPDRRGLFAGIGNGSYVTSLHQQQGAQIGNTPLFYEFRPFGVLIIIYTTIPSLESPSSLNRGALLSTLAWSRK